jgi:hypothetical protein
VPAGGGALDPHRLPGHAAFSFKSAARSVTAAGVTMTSCGPSPAIH